MHSEARPFGPLLKALREAAGFTQEELATIAGLSVHAISALERGERRRPQSDTVRALCGALELAPEARDTFVASARGYASGASTPERGRLSVPVPPTLLIGRTDDLDRLRQWTSDPAVRLITLLGSGGVGKTRLAVALAHELAADPAVRVLFVPLAALSDAARVAVAVAEAFGLDDATTRDLPPRVRAACGDQPTWLVLDNFEHLLTAAPLVADLLMRVAPLRVLVTSRAPLHLRGERECVVEPLALGAAVAFPTPADLADVPAVQLFVSRVQDVRSDFTLTPSNSPVVAAICRRLDGVPLALELAAPWVKALAPEKLLERLDAPGTILADGPSDLPERQRTMNGTVAWSARLLQASEQRAFRRLGAIPGPFSVGAATAVLAGAATAEDEEDTALHLVRALLDRSLLSRAEAPSSEEPQYVMLQTVRAYALDALRTSGELDETMDGLVRYCLAEGALAAPGIQGPAQIAWLDRVRLDLESHRAALAWLLAHERADEAAALAWCLVFFWIMRGHSAEGLRWFEDAQAGSAPGSQAHARSLAGAALMRFTQGDMDGARVASTRIALDPDADRDARAHALLCLGHVDYATGYLEAAREAFQRSRDLFHDAGITWGQGNGITGLAWVALGSGDPAEAATLLDDADAIWPTCGPWFRALGLYLRALLALESRHAHTALHLTRESLTSIRSFQDTFAFAYALIPLLVAASALDDQAWVARIAGARAAFADRTGSRAVDPLSDALCADAERRARAQRGPAAWAAEWEAGRRLSVDAILDEIDAALATSR